jgi:AraC-like DNA-binding protein
MQSSLSIILKKVDYFQYFFGILYLFRETNRIYMEYQLLLWAVMSHMEKRIRSELDYLELEKATGYSIAHIRDVFASLTKYSLVKYMLLRKIENAAFDIVHTDKKLQEIWPLYGFKNADTFTRAFRRVTGVNPGKFKKAGITVGRRKLYTGSFGVGFQDDRILLGMQVRDSRKETGIMSNEIVRREKNIIYNVPKVGYGIHGVTPLPICLKACTDFLGGDISYAYIMAASGAAFRFAWNEKFWDGGNVGVEHAYDSTERIYEAGLGCVSGAYSMLSRNSRSTKEEFRNFVMANIDKGNPVIALGIIGPPEAGIVTGYREYGDTLLGWNFFQDIPDFGGNYEKDENGYYISNDWWENNDTRLMMVLGDLKKEKYGLKRVLGNAITALNGRTVSGMAKGIAAYDAWKKAILDEKEFPEGITMPNLAERLMCQGDAMDCLADGRKCAVLYFQSIIDDYPEHKDMIQTLISQYKISCKTAHSMFEIFGGYERGEKEMLLLKKKSVRQQIVGLIDKAKKADIKALGVMRELHSQL